MKDINNKGDSIMQQKVMEEANQHFAISNFAEIVLDLSLIHI